LSGLVERKDGMDWIKRCTALEVERIKQPSVSKL